MAGSLAPSAGAAADGVGDNHLAADPFAGADADILGNEARIVGLENAGEFAVTEFLVGGLAAEQPEESDHSKGTQDENRNGGQDRPIFTAFLHNVDSTARWCHRKRVLLITLSGVKPDSLGADWLPKNMDTQLRNLVADPCTAVDDLNRILAEL